MKLTINKNILLESLVNVVRAISPKNIITIFLREKKIKVQPLQHTQKKEELKYLLLNSDILLLNIALAKKQMKFLKVSHPSSS